MKYFKSYENFQYSLNELYKHYDEEEDIDDKIEYKSCGFCNSLIIEKVTVHLAIKRGQVSSQLK